MTKLEKELDVQKMKNFNYQTDLEYISSMYQKEVQKNKANQQTIEEMREELDKLQYSNQHLKAYNDLEQTEIEAKKGNVLEDGRRKIEQT